jgi:hypothetical protein
VRGGFVLSSVIKAGPVLGIHRVTPSIADRCACNFRVADRPFIQSADSSRIAVDG